MSSPLVGWEEVLLYRTRRQHVIALAKFISLYGTSLGSMKLVNRRIQRRTRHLGPAALMSRFGADDGADLKWLFDGSNPGAHLAEYVIHRQDIARPLGLPAPVPAERLEAAMAGITQLPSVRIGARRRSRRGDAQAPSAHTLMRLAGRDR